MSEHTDLLVRLSPELAARLDSLIATREAGSREKEVARLLDEGLRMQEHPGVFFQDGPTGRRAVLMGGSDVWQVVEAVWSARTSEPTLSEARVLDLVHHNTGVARRLIKVALDYREAHPDEVDARVAANEEAERRLIAGWEKRAHPVG